MEPSPNQDKSQDIKNILDKIDLKEGNVIQKYSEDILLISRLLQGDILEIKETEGTISKYCNKGKEGKKYLYFNDNGTELEKEKEDEYKILLAILSEYIKINDYIFRFFEQFGIDLIKVLINGYLKFEDKEIDLLPIIQKLVPLIPEKVYIYIYYIYNQFSEIFMLDLKDNESEEKIKSSFKKFSDLFNAWKNMLNYDENLYKKNIFFYGNNSIYIEKKI